MDQLDVEQTDVNGQGYPDGFTEKRSVRPRAILRTAEVLEVVGLSRTTIWRRVQAGDFPAPIRLGPAGSRAVGWRSEEVEEWVRSRPAA